jgi:hypothetical protein
MEKDEKLQGVTSRQHETRAASKRRYEREMGPDCEERLWKDRARIVASYLKNPSMWPSGIDGKAWGCEVWYVPAEWRLEGDVAIRVVTERASVTGSFAIVTGNLPEGVTKGMGRPRKEGALSAAERMRRMRERRRGK